MNTNTATKPNLNKVIQDAAQAVQAKPVSTNQLDLSQIPGYDNIESFDANVRADLQISLDLFQRQYGSHELLEAAYISDEGKLCLEVPAERCHRKDPGFFQLIAQWPRVSGPALVCKLSLSFKLGTDRHLVMLSSGGGNGDPTGFMSINTSAEYDADALCAHGYIAAESHDAFLQHCATNVDVKSKQSRRILTPQDGSSIHIVLRHTVVPEEGRGREGIVSNKKPGEVANLCIENIYFQDAELLSQTTALKGTPSRPIRTANEIMSKYMGNSMASPVIPTMVVNCGDTVADVLHPNTMQAFVDSMQ